MKTNRTIIALFFLATSLFFSCKKGCTDINASNYNEKAKKEDGTCRYSSFIDFQLEHEVGSAALIFDDKKYTNAAGNVYSVINLKYYISNITLYEVNGNTFSDNGVYYVDVLDAKTTTLRLDNIADGVYTKISFTFGLDKGTNVTGGLENISVNNNMEWPDVMGGGYHYMKLEGKYVDTASVANETGYNIHFGASGGVPYDFTVVIDNSMLDIVVGSGKNYNIGLTMDVNQWFEGANIYDFKTYGGSVMGNASAQASIKANGEINLFKLVRFVGKLP